MEYIVVGLEPYQLVASGTYGKMKKPTELETAFVFAKLDGPLITLDRRASKASSSFRSSADSEDPDDNLLDYFGKLISVDGKQFFTVSIEVGASLDLMGPRLRGRVKVDLWVVSFNIAFGPDAKKGDPPSFSEFYDMVLQSGQPESIVESVLAVAAPASRDSNTQIKKSHIFTCRGGIVNDSNNRQEASRYASSEEEKNAPWAAKANEFAFAIDVVFALTHAKVKKPKEVGEDPDVPE
ncbi:hypothetical protein F4777DRAFT_575353 [Nemania sp. FL0916]|nr:hypothetical protein F4777DRAFT_575353 [Nemania sp. FL0916]